MEFQENLRALSPIKPAEHDGAFEAEKPLFLLSLDTGSDELEQIAVYDGQTSAELATQIGRKYQLSAHIVTVLAREIERGILETTVDRLSVADEYVEYPVAPTKTNEHSTRATGSTANKENLNRRDSETTQRTCGSETVLNSEKYRRYFEAQRKTLESF